MDSPVSISYFTICARNYLAYAATLAASLARTNSQARLKVFLADAAPDNDTHGQLPDGLDIIPVQTIPLPDHEDMAMRYTVMEFATAVKPFCFRYLFEAGAEKAVFLDPDIFVTGPLTEITAAFDDGADAILTPHLDAPLPEDGATPTTADIAASGVYNLGFLGLHHGPATEPFLAWWERKCATECFNDLQRGLFVDQKFVDMLPAFVPGTHILRHKGYNVAYWNLPTRPIAGGPDGSYTAGGAPLRFFHFSGVVPNDPSVFSKHQTRFRPENIGAPLRALQADYLTALDRHGHPAFKSIDYAHGTFDDGTPIPPAARRIYTALKDSDGQVQIRPFTPMTDHLNAPAAAIDQTLGAPITELMHQIWRMRPDLQAAFPLTSARVRRGFHAWFLRHKHEHTCDEVFMAPARKGVGGIASRLADHAPAAVKTRLKARYAPVSEGDRSDDET